MQDSGFKGKLPKGLFKLSKLKRLELNGNQLHNGVLPAAFSKLKKLTYGHSYRTRSGSVAVRTYPALLPLAFEECRPEGGHGVVPS